MENGNAAKKPVLGRLAKNFRLMFIACFVVCTTVFTVLAVKMPDTRNVFLIVMGGCDVVFLVLLYVVPVLACYGNYCYSLSPDGVTLYRKDEEVMTMKWEETEVSLGSFISKGGEKNPAVCAKAICFTRKGCMRDPQRFPKRALKGAAGELCIAFSKSRLKEVFQACGGNISGNIHPDGCRLSFKDTEVMQSSLEKLKDKAAKQAAAAEAKAAKAAAAGEDEAL